MLNTDNSVPGNVIKDDGYTVYMCVYTSTRYLYYQVQVVIQYGSNAILLVLEYPTVVDYSLLTS